MADGAWKGVHSKQLSLNKFFDPSTLSMRKSRDGEKKNGKKIMTFIGPLTLLPVDRLNADQLERRTLVPKGIRLK